MERAFSWIPSSEPHETQLGNWNFKEFKLGIEAKHVDDVCKEEEASCFETEQSELSLPTKLAHLGLHDQPTKTPMKTAIQRGAMNNTSSPKTSTIVGLRKISKKTETTAMAKKPKCPNPKPKQTKKKKILEQTQKWKEKRRKTLDSIGYKCVR